MRRGAAGPRPRTLVTGAGGMLARAVVPALERAGHEVRPLRRGEADVTDAEALRRAADDRYLRQVAPAPGAVAR